MRSYTAEELVTQTGFDRRTIAYYIQQGLLPRVGRRGPRTRYPGYVRDRLLFIRRVREAEEAGEIEPMSLSELRELFEQAHPELIARVADRRLSAADALQALAAEPGHVRTDRGPAARHLARERAFRAKTSTRGSAPNLEAGPDRDTGADLWIEPDEAEGPGRSAESLIADEPREAAYVAAMSPEFAGPPGVSDSRQPPVASSAPEEGDSAPPEGLAAALSEELLEGLAAALSEELSELQLRAQDLQHRKPGLTERWMRVKISSEISLSVRGIADEDAPLLDSAGRHLRRLIDRRGNRRDR